MREKKQTCEKGVYVWIARCCTLFKKKTSTKKKIFIKKNTGFFLLSRKSVGGKMKAKRQREILFIWCYANRVLSHWEIARE